MSKDELLGLVAALRTDLTDALAKLSELQREIAALDLPEQEAATCPQCRAKFRGPVALSEHIYLAHDGPLPATWERADSIAM